MLNRIFANCPGPKGLTRSLWLPGNLAEIETFLPKLTVLTVTLVLHSYSRRSYLRPQFVSLIYEKATRARRRRCDPHCSCSILSWLEDEFSPGEPEARQIPGTVDLRSLRRRCCRRRYPLYLHEFAIEASGDHLGARLGSEFLYPSYVGVGRELAERGFPTISVNTRMHDIGNVEKYTLLGKRVRGGGYWGTTSEDARDIAAWIDYAQQLGYGRVVLVGHSAGWASVARYQADSQDRRVAGLVFGSPGVGYSPQPDDPQLLAQAKKLVDEGAGEDLIRLPHRSTPSFVSAATELDIANTPRQYKDFFGTQTPDAAITRVTCPVLAFFGSKDDIGGEKDLALLTSSVRRLAHGPARVDTAMIANGNHEYVGEEAQVAQVITRWIETEVEDH